MTLARAVVAGLDDSVVWLDRDELADIEARAGLTREQLLIAEQEIELARLTPDSRARLCAALKCEPAQLPAEVLVERLATMIDTTPIEFTGCGYTFDHAPPDPDDPHERLLAWLVSVLDLLGAGAVERLLGALRFDPFGALLRGGEDRP